MPAAGEEAQRRALEQKWKQRTTTKPTWNDNPDYQTPQDSDEMMKNLTISLDYVQTLLEKTLICAKCQHTHVTHLEQEGAECSSTTTIVVEAISEKSEQVSNDLQECIPGVCRLMNCSCRLVQTARSHSQIALRHPSIATDHVSSPAADQVNDAVGLLFVSA